MDLPGMAVVAEGDATINGKTVGRYSATPTAIRRPAPRIGEQSVELLREAGYDEEAIERMLARGVTLQPEPTKDSE